MVSLNTASQDNTDTYLISTLIHPIALVASIFLAGISLALLVVDIAQERRPVVPMVALFFSIVPLVVATATTSVQRLTLVEDVEAVIGSDEKTSNPYSVPDSE